MEPWHPLDGDMIAADAHYDPDDMPDDPPDDDGPEYDAADDGPEYDPDDRAQRGYDSDREENRDADEAR